MKVDAGDWPSISALLDSALDQPSELRERWLDELPEPARAFRATLVRLLADRAQAQAEDFLGELPKSAIEADPSPEPPQIVGPYTLLRELGRGAWAASGWPSAAMVGPNARSR